MGESAESLLCFIEDLTLSSRGYSVYTLALDKRLNICMSCTLEA